MPPKARKAGPVEVVKTPKATSAARGSKTAESTAKDNAAQATTTTTNETKSKTNDKTRPQKKASQADGSKSDSKTQPIRPRPDVDPLLGPFYYGKSLTDPINTARDKWNLLPAFLKVKGLIKQHTDSFNYFVETDLKNIVKANAMIYTDIDPNIFIRFTDIRVGMPTRAGDHASGYMPGPQVTPNECRLRDLTYAAPIVVDYDYRDAAGLKQMKNASIGRMPIMLRSSRCILTGKSSSEMSHLNECSIDPGGYFVVRGQEKVILVQEQLSKNRVIVESQKGIIQASVTSHTANVKTKTYVLLKKGAIVLKHNSLSEDIPVVILLRAMGVHSDREIMELAAGDNKVYQESFQVNLEDVVNQNIFTQEQALDYIGNRVKPDRFGSAAFGAPKKTSRQQAVDKIANTIIPHVTVSQMNFRPKAIYIAFMVRRLLMAMADPKLVDDRDYVGNKRLELAGSMLSLLFEDLFKDFCRMIKQSMHKELSKPNRAMAFAPARHVAAGEAHVSSRMERAISTGNWSLKRFRMDRAGVTHVLSRLSYVSALGMMTRITSQFEKTRKVSGPRALQPSQFGMLCVADTPEGEACGLVKNLALMTHITTADEDEPVRRMIFVLGAEDVGSGTGREMYRHGAYIIFLNGTPVALTQFPKGFLDGFRKFRRMGRVSEFVSIYINHHHNGVHIATDEGRICRPLIVVEQGRSKVSARYLDALRKGVLEFDDFLSRGLVEYLDVNEENDSNIAVYEKDINNFTTHLEIEPFTILGAVAGLIPYPHHNQSPRNT